VKPAAVVIGAGVNELVAAHYLARAGCAVTLVRSEVALERADTGWVTPRLAHDLGIDPRLLGAPCADPWAIAPLPGGGRLELTSDVGASAEAIRRLSARDAERWPEFCARMHAHARVLGCLYAEPPPDPMATALRDLARLARGALRVRGLGRSGMEAFLRLLPMSAADFLDDWFESDALKGVLGAAGVMHAFQGPRSGGTAFGLLHHHVGSAPGVFRPPLTNLRAALGAVGGVTMRGGTVARIETKESRITGVALAGGETIPAPLVVSGLPPARTLLEMTDPGLLDPQLVRALRNVRSRGVVAELELVLDRHPGSSTLVIAPALDYLERAYDDAKYGRVSTHPYMEARYEGTDAQGKHRVRVHVQYVPYALRDAVWDTALAQNFGRAVLAKLSEHAPGLSAALVGQHVLTPHDLEHLYGFPQGQAYHAELALDQVLWMRPLPELAQYRTPLPGLYLCGPAMHPGAGVAGAAGANAAAVILGDLRRGVLKVKE